MQDFVANLKQIFNYPNKAVPGPADWMLLQEGPGAGAYFNVTVAALVSNGLAAGGFMQFLPGTGGIAFIGTGASMTFDSGQFGFNMPVAAPSMNADTIFLNGESVATQPWVTMQLTALQTLIGFNTVRSWNGRIGEVFLDETDILRAGGVLALNARLEGRPTAPTPWDPRDCTRTIPTTEWVQHLFHFQLCEVFQNKPFVFSFNNRTGQVVLLTEDVNAAYFSTDPLGATPQAPTPAVGDASNAIATTLYVTTADTNLHTTITNEWQAADQALANTFAPINSPQFTGTPSGPTANPGTHTGQLATTAFVMNAITAATTGVASFNTRTGAVTLTAADLTGAGGALLASPSFTGAPLAPTATVGTATTQIATTAFVQQAIANTTTGVSSFNTRTGAVVLTLADVTGTAVLNNTPLTGVPIAPTASPGTSTTQLATTAFVMAAVAASTAGVSSWNTRTGAVTLLSSDISAAQGALINSPTFTGIPAAPTASVGTSTTQLATTAFVQNAITASFVSPTFLGTPTAPTAAPGNSTQQLATTAFVQAAISAMVGVTSFNTRTGAVTLTLADVTGTNVLNNTNLSGIPVAPTATPGTSTTQLATTAFVAAAIAAGGAGVSSFNTRTGAVTLTGADVSSAGGALIASPTFTGTPAAPTAAPGTSTTQLATTAFVAAAIGAGAGVTSFNSRTGAVTLTSADVHAFAVLLAGDTMSGALTIAMTNPAFTLNKAAAGQTNQFFGRMGGNARWGLQLGDTNAESGSNAGSDFTINRYTDAGAVIDAPFQIVRSTGQIPKVLQPNFTANLTKGFTFTTYNWGNFPATFTVDATLGNYQYGQITGGGINIYPPGVDCAVDIMTYSATATGYIVWAGSWTVGSSTGDPVNINGGARHVLSIRRMNGISTYTVKALQ